MPRPVPVSPLFVPIGMLSLMLAAPNSQAVRWETDAGPHSHGAPAQDWATIVGRQEAVDLPGALADSHVEAHAKRSLFIATLLPLVLLENEGLLRQRARMVASFRRLDEAGALAPAELAWLRQLAREFRVADDPITEPEARRELWLRVDAIPVELALAQAAVESGWGASKSARRDRNLFGLRGFVPPPTRKPAKKHKSRAPRFATLRESVHAYLATLNAHGAYRRLRALRAKLRADNKPLRGMVLAEGLHGYSVRGAAYVAAIRALIRHNGLDRYAVASLAPPQPQELAFVAERRGG